MGKIGYGYGSEWHLVRYLGYHRNHLSEQILGMTGGQSLSWLDFGFANHNNPLVHDQELVGLNFIDNPQTHKCWRAFWPGSGMSQNWDAVGIIQYENHQEWLLVEAKAHLKELESTCSAKSPNSIEKINAALTQAMDAFCDSPMPVENWLSPYYQFANRLAVLHFLTQVCDPPIPARLLFIYFCGDRREDATCPQTAAEWEPAIKEMNARLGINTKSELYQHIHHLFLHVNPNAQSHG